MIFSATYNNCKLVTKTKDKDYKDYKDYELVFCKGVDGAPVVRVGYICDEEPEDCFCKTHPTFKYVFIGKKKLKNVINFKYDFRINRNPDTGFSFGPISKVELTPPEVYLEIEYC